MGNHPSADRDLASQRVPPLGFVRTPRGLGVAVPQQLLLAEEKRDDGRIVVRLAGTREVNFQLEEVLLDPGFLTRTLIFVEVIIYYPNG